MSICSHCIYLNFSLDYVDYVDSFVLFIPVTLFLCVIVDRIDKETTDYPSGCWCSEFG